MGVQGLTTYIRDQGASLGIRKTFSPVVSGHSKEDGDDGSSSNLVPLVIDAWSFVYTVWFKNHECFDGGDYSSFLQTVTIYISTWRKFGLEPVMVWDGPFEPIKIPTIESRIFSHVRQIHKYMRSSDSLRSHSAFRKQNAFLPLLASDACKEAARSQGVRMFFVDGEADSAVAELAGALNGYECSQDSDFFIFPSQSRGYIPLDSMTYHDDTSLQTPSARLDAGQGWEVVRPRETKFVREVDRLPSCTTFSVKIFQHTQTAKHFGVNPRLLPLFAAIIGNDYSKLAALNSLNVVVHPSQYGSLSSSIRIRAVASSLSKASVPNSIESARTMIKEVVVDLVRTPLSSAGLDQVTDTLIDSMSRYTLYQVIRPALLDPSSCHIHLSDRCTLPAVSPRSTDSPERAESRSAFREAYREGYLRPCILEILEHGRYVQDMFMEGPDYQSCQTRIARPIRVWMYAWLDWLLGIRQPEVKDDKEMVVTDEGEGDLEGWVGEEGQEGEGKGEGEGEDEGEGEGQGGGQEGGKEGVSDDASIELEGDTDHTSSQATPPKSITETIRRGDRASHEVVQIPSLSSLLPSIPPNLAASDDETRMTVYLSASSSNTDSVRRLAFQATEPSPYLHIVCALRHLNATLQDTRFAWSRAERRATLEVAVLSFTSPPAEVQAGQPATPSNAETVFEIQRIAEVMSTLEALTQLSESLLLPIPPAHRTYSGPMFLERLRLARRSSRTAGEPLSDEVSTVVGELMVAVDGGEEALGDGKGSGDDSDEFQARSAPSKRKKKRKNRGGDAAVGEAGSSVNASTRKLPKNPFDLLGGDTAS